MPISCDIEQYRQPDQSYGPGQIVFQDTYDRSSRMPGGADKLDLALARYDNGEVGLHLRWEFGLPGQVNDTCYTSILFRLTDPNRDMPVLQALATAAMSTVSQVNIWWPGALMRAVTDTATGPRPADAEGLIGAYKRNLRTAIGEENWTDGRFDELLKLDFAEDIARSGLI